MKTNPVALYVCASTPCQSTDDQLQERIKVAEEKGWSVVKQYIDTSVQGRGERPAFNQLYQAVLRQEFEVIMAWSIDQLCGSTKKLITFFPEMHRMGIDVYLHQQGIDTTIDGGEELFEMCNVFLKLRVAG